MVVAQAVAVVLRKNKERVVELAAFVQCLHYAPDPIVEQTDIGIVVSAHPIYRLGGGATPPDGRWRVFALHALHRGALGWRLAVEFVFAADWSGQLNAIIAR